MAALQLSVPWCSLSPTQCPQPLVLPRVWGQGCRQPLITPALKTGTFQMPSWGEALFLFLGLGSYWWTKKAVKTVFAVESSLPSPPAPIQFLIQWHAAGCHVHCTLWPQVFAFKACLLMQEDICNKLITLLSNDPCINIRSLVAVTFNMRKKILKKLNLKCPSATVMRPSFISEAALPSQQGPLQFHGRRQKM